ncbi:glucodextranase DOMON-like domain-containing protein [Microbacterium dextranolyticum]|uniref:Dextranase n=1 Tax=Microbacterium dextranolyticum TaxID=36806 RepID=A0A9W6M5M6_9MICO|nr:glucodextranase DOMON-like domain-containing protein [Microbacterium dextranolyticum]MBM7463899.1 hypothetical protein [Microbacterium dextranolyticum]GLJ94981.1 hypothetical protein GCM10017591_10430 [Microbacterium dextranolyticum]
MTRARHSRWGIAATAALVASLLGATAAPAAAAPEAAAAPPAHGPIDSSALTTWGHDKVDTTTGPIADDAVRGSEFYSASVSLASAPDTAYSSFVYMNVPRSGEGKRGYDEQDGAEFSSSADLSMSWSSFEYSEDVWVNVTLTTGQHISSADQVTVRPTSLNLEKQLVDSSTIRVKVPYSAQGLRFSVEFDPQQLTSYNDMSGDSGVLTTVAAGNRAVATEPQNSMLVFANPKLTGSERDRLIPTDASGTIYKPAPGLVNDLDHMTADILYFEPGTYYMGDDYRAQLPANVKWIYLAPGAYVKGAFRFPDSSQPAYKVTGRGVLSGEQYVYEANTAEGYAHNTKENCHVDCVKMLQFESSNKGQTLDMEGLTINAPPYHSFVVYAHDETGEIGVENFRMDVSNYKQVGSWYWQTDGLELYPDGHMRDTFFHANDDVLKLYHSDVKIERTVIWKNENGPVIQWGWTPRNIDGVTVSDTDIIHNRMGWKDVKYNTCVFNSSSHWEDMGATDRADVSTTVKNMHFTNTRVEGAVNCGIRIFALSNTENIQIDGFSVDAWNGLGSASQVSLLQRYTDRSGAKVTIGNEMTDRNGILLHDYSVGGVPILKSGDKWASDELGRLNFDVDTWDDWNATSDDAPTGTAPQLAVDGLADGSVATARNLTVTGTTDAPRVSVTVNGVTSDATVAGGAFTAPVTLPDITNRIVVTATGANGVETVVRRTITALGTVVGSLTDPTGDDNGPGSYTYPTDSAFNPGSFDLTGLTVYRDGDTVRFVTKVAGEVRNPWFGQGMSTQRVNIYLRDGDSTATTPLLPGTNTSAAGAWTRAIVASGRFADSPYGAGVFTPDGQRIARPTIEVNGAAGEIIASVPASTLGDVDLSKTGYQVSMFADAESGEGVGNVRPIYSTECAQGVGCPDFVGPYRGAGGAGSFDGDLASRDTDTRDSNAFDMITGDADQHTVMDWTRGPVVAPYVVLDTSDAPVERTPEASLTAARVTAGGQIVVTGSQFGANEGISLWLQAAPAAAARATDVGAAALAEFSADASGAFAQTATVPANLAAGAYRLEVRGASSGSVWFDLTVDAANTGGGGTDTGHGDGGSSAQPGGSVSAPTTGGTSGASHLEATGGEFSPWPLWGAGALLLAGAIALVVARRRRSHSID